MELQQTYREHLTQRIQGLLDEIHHIHDLCGNKLQEADNIDDPEERLDKVNEINPYLNKADYLGFEVYMLIEVRSLLCK